MFPILINLNLAHSGREAIGFEFVDTQIVMTLAVVQRPSLKEAFSRD